MSRRSYSSLLTMLTLASCASSTPATAPPVQPPTLAVLVASVNREAFVRDLTAIAIPRHHVAAPAGLAQVETYLAQRFEASGLTVTRQAVHYGDAVANNVIAERRGTDPSHVVILCAHYDAVPGTPGADDDGSGVAVLVTVARAIAAANTAATIRLVAFAFEEEGLVGSAQYANALSDAERHRIVAVFDMDMVAYADPRPGSQRYPDLPAFVPRAILPSAGDFLGVLVRMEDTLPAAAIRAARAYVPRLHVVAVPVPTGLDRALPDLGRGDHASFWQVGVPAVMVGDSGDFRNPNYHAPGDTMSTLDVGFAVDSARFMLATVVSAANM